MRRDQREVVHAPRVGERVKRDDLERGRLQDVADEVQRDESRPAGDQYSLRSRHGSEAYPSPGSALARSPGGSSRVPGPSAARPNQGAPCGHDLPAGAASRTSHPSSPFDLGASNPPKSAGCRAKRSITAASRVGLMNLTTTRWRLTSSAIPSNPLRSSRATSSGEASATSCSKDPCLEGPGLLCVRPDGYSDYPGDAEQGRNRPRMGSIAERTSEKLCFPPGSDCPVSDARADVNREPVVSGRLESLARLPTLRRWVHTDEPNVVRVNPSDQGAKKLTLLFGSASNRRGRRTGGRDSGVDELQAIRSGRIRRMSSTAGDEERNGNRGYARKERRRPRLKAPCRSCTEAGLRPRAGFCPDTRRRARG